MIQTQPTQSIPDSIPEAIADLLAQAAIAFTEKNNTAARQYAEQALAQDANDPAALDMLGVILAEREGRTDEGVGLILRAIALVPGNMMFRSHLIQLLVLAGRLDDARSVHAQTQPLLDEALAIDPRHYEALKWSAVFYSYLDDANNAKTYYQRMLAIQPHAADVWHSLAQLNDRLGDLDAAEACLWHIVTDGAVPHAKETLAITLKNQNKPVQALAMYQAAQKDHPEQTGLLYEESELRLLLGDYARAWPLYEQRWSYHAMGAPAGADQFWHEGIDLQGKTILVFCDQGIGDSVMLMRYLPLLKARGATIHVGIRSTLVRLCEEMGVVSHYYLEDPAPNAPPNPERPKDYSVAMGSLCTAFKTTLSTIPPTPYLKAPDYERLFWRERLRAFKGKKVGIVWSGNPAQKADHRRSMSFQHFFSMLNSEATAGITFFNLQKFPKADDVPAMQASRVVDWMPEVRDYADTAALIAELDLVISTCTSSVHVAGGLGIPVWVLLSYVADWRWLLDRTDSPWYESATLFRQPKAGDWESVMHNVQQSLVDFQKE